MTDLSRLPPKSHKLTYSTHQNAINAHLEPEPSRKKWRKRFSKAPHVHPNNNGNFYFINGTTPNPIYLPSLPQEGGGEGGGRYPGQTTMNGNPASYQPYFHPGSCDGWAVDRNGMNGANVNMNVNPNANMNANVMAAQIDDFEDQEKRLFLEEFRYPGQHTVRIDRALVLLACFVFVVCCFTDVRYFVLVAVRASLLRPQLCGTEAGQGNGGIHD